MLVGRPASHFGDPEHPETTVRPRSAQWRPASAQQHARDVVAVRASRRSGDLNHKLAVLRYHFRPQRSGTMDKNDAPDRHSDGQE
ncbi:unnamed protein product [Merluccius merluccius]